MLEFGRCVRHPLTNQRVRHYNNKFKVWRYPMNTNRLETIAKIVRSEKYQLLVRTRSRFALKLSAFVLVTLTPRTPQEWMNGADWA